MRRIPITFRELLERILPSDQLSPTDLARVKEALAGGSQGELERLAFYHLERLANQGVVRRLPDRVEGGERVLRFQLLDSLEVVSLRYETPPLPPGLVSYPRELVTYRGAASAARLRPLLSLDHGLIREDNRLPASRAELIGGLLRLARELLECDSAAFFATTPEGEPVASYAPPPGEEALLEPWAGVAVLERDQILSCPDTTRCRLLQPGAEALGLRALAAVRVRALAAGVLGFFEVRSRTPGFFDAERLSLLSLLAENSESMLTQAARLERLVYVDPLTGIFNRSFFQRQIVTEVARARREGKSLALCIADIDDFKRFNTDYGYEAGNRVLAEVARLLKGGVRPFDSVARWGGEEFALLLAAPVGHEDAETVAQRLRRAIESAELEITGLDGREHRVRLTASIGVSIFPDDANNPDDLWRRANQALLVAKQPPKNRIVFFCEIEGEGRSGHGSEG